MPRAWAPARARRTVSGEQHERSAAAADGSCQRRMVTPTTSRPRSRSSIAATALSTPPLIATATRPSRASGSPTAPRRVEAHASNARATASSTTPRRGGGRRRARRARRRGRRPTAAARRRGTRRSGARRPRSRRPWPRRSRRPGSGPRDDAVLHQRSRTRTRSPHRALPDSPTAWARRQGRRPSASPDGAWPRAGRAARGRLPTPAPPAAHPAPRKVRPATAAPARDLNLPQQVGDGRCPAHRDIDTASPVMCVGSRSEAGGARGRARGSLDRPSRTRRPLRAPFVPFYQRDELTFATGPPPVAARIHGCPATDPRRPPVIVPPPAPSYTLAPDLGPLSPGQRLALEACLTALTGRLAGVLVTTAVSTETHHVIELITPAGSLIALERHRRPGGRRPDGVTGALTHALARAAAGDAVGTLGGRMTTRRDPRGVPLLLRAPGTPADPLRVARPLRGRSVGPAHDRRHAAAEVLLPRGR